METHPRVPTSIILILQLRKLNSERLTPSMLHTYLNGAVNSVIASLLLSILPSNRYSYNFLHKLDSDGFFSINHFLGGGYSLYGTSTTYPNSFKELLFNPGVSDGESHSQASRIWDCKSNIYLFIWPDVDRLNSGHLPLINMC